MKYIVVHGNSKKVFDSKKRAILFKDKYIADCRYDYGKTPKVKILKK
jgi:hypothetical protein